MNKLINKLMMILYKIREYTLCRPCRVLLYDISDPIRKDINGDFVSVYIEEVNYAKRLD